MGPPGAARSLRVFASLSRASRGSWRPPGRKSFRPSLGNALYETMSATVSQAPSLLIFAPASALPAEGHEHPLAPVDSISGLLRAYQSIVSNSAPVFTVTRDGIDWPGDSSLDSALHLVDFRTEGSGGLPSMGALPAMSRIDWAGVVSQVSDAIAAEHFIGTPDHLAHVFATAAREAATQAAKGFAGVPLPLLSIEQDSTAESAAIRFLGVWLSDSGMGGEAAQVTDSSCVLLDGIEAEGRGLREALLGATMLALVIHGPAQAGEGRSSGPRSAGWLASLFSGSGRGEILKVTSQRLVQAPPRIHRDALETPAAAPLRVVIDIGAQRAYLLKGGRIAFETPVSTGQGRAWTPRGTFTITEKVRTGKMSTIYKCPLPGWMRIGDTKVGMHEGVLPGYPASHGCIRMPIESAYFIYDHAPRGTVVQIVDSWIKPGQEPEQTLVAQR